MIDSGYYTRVILFFCIGKIVKYQDNIKKHKIGTKGKIIKSRYMIGKTVVG